MNISTGVLQFLNKLGRLVEVRCDVIWPDCIFIHHLANLAFQVAQPNRRTSDSHSCLYIIQAVTNHI